MTKPELTRGSTARVPSTAQPTDASTLYTFVSHLSRRKVLVACSETVARGWSKVARGSRDGHEDIEPTALGTSEEGAAEVPAAFPSLTLGFRAGLSDGARGPPAPSPSSPQGSCSHLTCASLMAQT